MEKRKLTEICNPKQWKTIPTSELVEAGYPVYGANGIIGFYNEYNHEEKTIAITCRGATCGTVNLTCPKAYITGNAMCLDDVNNTVILEYLFYAMKAYDFSKVISGSAQPQITRQGIEKVEVVVYPTKKQQQIVCELQKVESLVALRKEQLVKLDELVKSRFVELFGTSSPNDIDGEDYVSVASVCSSMMIGPFGSALHKPEMSTTGEVFVLGTDNAVKNEFAIKEERFISSEKYSELTKYTVKSGDIIITMMGTIGRVAVIPDDFHKAIISSHLSCLTPDLNVIYPRFLHAVLTLDDGISLQIAQQKKGAIMSGLNLGIIKNLKFKMVDKEKQKVFLDFAEQTDKSKLAIQQSLEKLETLKKALMQKYFG